MPPGRALRKLRSAAVGSLKRFGLPARVGEDSNGRTRTPFDCTFQLVAQRLPSNGDGTGIPLFQRKMPVICQLPTTASNTFGMPPNKALLLPNGSSASQFALMV